MTIRAAKISSVRYAVPLRAPVAIARLSSAAEERCGIGPNRTGKRKLSHTFRHTATTCFSLITFNCDKIASGVDACLSEHFRHPRRVAWDEGAPGSRTVCPALTLN